MQDVGFNIFLQRLYFVCSSARIFVGAPLYCVACMVYYTTKVGLVQVFIQIIFVFIEILYNFVILFIVCHCPFVLFLSVYSFCYL